jgi:hypothetical protein
MKVKKPANNYQLIDNQIQISMNLGRNPLDAGDAAAVLDVVDQRLPILK